ncbi:hypothetical protein [Acidovorax sp.]
MFLASSARTTCANSYHLCSNRQIPHLHPALTRSTHTNSPTAPS